MRSARQMGPIKCKSKLANVWIQYIQYMKKRDYSNWIKTEKSGKKIKRKLFTQWI